MATKDLCDYYRLTGQLFEIARQLHQPNGYPFDPGLLQFHLQCLIEGEFPDPIYPIFRGRYPDFASLLAATDLHNPKRYHVNERNFPLQVKPEQAQIVGVKLVHFSESVTLSEVWEKFKEDGLEKPITDDAFHFCAQYPKIQRHIPIIFPHEPVEVWDSNFNSKIQGSQMLRLGTTLVDGDSGRKKQKLVISPISSAGHYENFMFAGICKLDGHPLASWI